jgi:hypothetical protein
LVQKHLNIKMREIRRKIYSEYWVDSRVRTLLNPSPVYHSNPPLDLICIPDVIIYNHTKSNFSLPWQDLIFSLYRLHFLSLFNDGLYCFGKIYIMNNHTVADNKLSFALKARLNSFIKNTNCQLNHL